jgi:hypothetical protein
MEESMKSAFSLLVTLSLVTSALPLSAQEQTSASPETRQVVTTPSTPGPITRAMVRETAQLAAAEPAEERVGSIVDRARQLARELGSEPIPASSRLAQAPSVRHDSLKDGALRGLIIGAVSLGGFLGAYCAAWSGFDEGGCLPWTLGFAALGGGIGAGIGVGVDALSGRRSPVTVRASARPITF